MNPRILVARLMALAMLSLLVGAVFSVLENHTPRLSVDVPLAAIEGPIALSEDVKENITNVVEAKRPETIEVVYCATAGCSQAGVFRTAEAVKMFLADEFPEIEVYDSPSAGIRDVATAITVELVFN